MPNRLTITPETTLGPFYPETFVPLDSNDLTRVRFGQPAANGEVVRIFGKITDENGVGSPRILIELWQANAEGAYRHPNEPDLDALDPNFDGWGRVLSDDQGDFEFLTVVPGAPAGRAPHVNMTLFGTGIDRLQTAMFFPGTPELEGDPVFKAAGDRSPALLGADEGVEGVVRQLRFDIHMRGENETPFFLD